MKKFLFFVAILSSTQGLWAQLNRWQQRVEYTMDIDMDVVKNRFDGTQTLIYHNNSTDTLFNVYYHLYFNAFQPGSEMDTRIQTIPDPESTVAINKGTMENPIYVSKVSKLALDEQGWTKINSLKQNGKPLKYEINSTILEVALNTPILPGTSDTFTMTFKSQVPLQTRRNGRDNAEGVRYSMAQWYPKMAEYDYQGWHADPYVGREFYGVWGDFDVTIHIDPTYVLGGSGYVQNGDEVGHGYESDPSKVKQTGGKLAWHFIAPNVHDFAWGADPEFIHETMQVPDGPLLHFLHKNNVDLNAAWRKLPEYFSKAFVFMNQNFGKYPYKQFTVCQGGDGGMEYPMFTLITGKRNFGSLVGVTIHEAFHNWYYGILGSNESANPWMDEGFTSYATAITSDYLFDLHKDNPNQGSYEGYYQLANSGLEQPLSTHGDHYNTNRAYGAAAYNKGATFVAQLEYIIGKKNLDKAMLRYFNTWKMQHPNPNDFIREVEKTCNLELDWYKDYFVNTTFTIDYAVKDVDASRKKTTILLRREGVMPMPVDVLVELKDGKKIIYNIPLDLMLGNKPQQDTTADYIVMPDWRWVNPTYELEVDIKKSEIKSITIDPRNICADLNKDNNVMNF